MQNDPMLQKAAEMIETEARARLAEDPCCQGGLAAKIHGVYMELCHILKERMPKKP